MSDTASLIPDDVQTSTPRFVPKLVNSLEEAGITASLAEQLLLKNLYFRGEVSGREMARLLGMRFSVIEPVLDFLKRGRLVEVKRSAGFGNISSVFAASETGRVRAKEYLDNNQFLGPAPVPLKQYEEVVRNQTVSEGWMTKEVLERAFTGAIVTGEFYSKLGPAVNSFKSLLIYGRPGNGKSFLSEQLARLDASRFTFRTPSKPKGRSSKSLMPCITNPWMSKQPAFWSKKSPTTTSVGQSVSDPS